MEAIDIAAEEEIVAVAQLMIEAEEAKPSPIVAHEIAGFDG